MRSTSKFLFSFSIIFMLAISIIFIGKGNVSFSLSRIVSKVDIVDACGIKILREEYKDNLGENKVRFKLTDIPKNINITNAKIVHKGNVYSFCIKTKVLLDNEGKEVDNLEENSYTVKLDIEEFGTTYKMINKCDNGYKFLDIKFNYNKNNNSLDMVSSSEPLKNMVLTIFKKDLKIGETKIKENGKANIFIKDMENLETSTYTVLVKNGSEIFGIDVFHLTPSYRDLNLEGNIEVSSTSLISNRVKVTIKNESGININDKVCVVSVYEEGNSAENLLLNLDDNKNTISNLFGEIVLRSSLNNDKKYKVRLKINGIILDSQNDLDVKLSSIDVSKIKVCVTEDIGKDLTVDLSGVKSLGANDNIEAVSFYDVNNKDKTFIVGQRLTNKVNDLKINDFVSSKNSYEFLLKINEFLMDPIGCEVNFVDLSSGRALTDIVSSKVFICLEDVKGLKVTDKVVVSKIFKEGFEDTNLLKSEYNTTIEKLNGTVFLNTNLDTKNNYYVKFRVNDVELEKLLRVTVNNNISFIGASIKVENCLQEIKLDFKNVDAINNNDLIEVLQISDLSNKEENLLDKEKDVKIFNKVGSVYSKVKLLNKNKYGIKIKVNGVEFNDFLKVNMDENINISSIKPYSDNENKLILDFTETNIPSNAIINILSLKLVDDSIEFLPEKIRDLIMDSDKKIEINTENKLENGRKYILVFNIVVDETIKEVNLEFENSIRSKNIGSEVETPEIQHENINLNKSFILIDSLDFSDCGFKFPHKLDNPKAIKSVVCDFLGVVTEIDGNFIVVSKLIPMKIYNNMKIDIYDENGLIKEFQIEKFEMKESTDILKNFISKTYINLKSEANAKKENYVYGEEVGFYYWYNKLMKKESTLREFILNLLNEEEFLDRHVNHVDKIRILYKVVFSIDPSDQSLDIWVNEFNKNCENESVSKALRITTEKMFTNCKFKALEKQLK